MQKKAKKRQLGVREAEKANKKLRDEEYDAVLEAQRKVRKKFAKRLKAAHEAEREARERASASAKRRYLGKDYCIISEGGRTWFRATSLKKYSEVIEIHGPCVNFYEPYLDGGQQSPRFEGRSTVTAAGLKGAIRCRKGVFERKVREFLAAHDIVL